MATLVPTSQPTGVEAYEDMFKEITRKLYGDETGHGLHTLGTPIAHVVTGGPTAPEGGERSFTTLVGVFLLFLLFSLLFFHTYFFLLLFISIFFFFAYIFKNKI